MSSIPSSADETRQKAPRTGADRLDRTEPHALDLRARRAAARVALEDREDHGGAVEDLCAELVAIEREAGTRRKRRAQQHTVALVGYTNAGKSSWMRALTGSGVRVEDKLFAALDTTVRALHPETTPRILVSDTVGLVRKLPHDLVASSRSALDEACDADLSLHLVDASDPAFPAQTEVTRALLREIGATEAPRRLAFDEVDKIGAATRERLAAEGPDAIQASVKQPADVARLPELVVSFFEREVVDADLVVPYVKQRVVAEAHAACRVLTETHGETGTLRRARAARGDRAPAHGALSAGVTWRAGGVEVR
jgi:GTP-binding protein HflX